MVFDMKHSLQDEDEALDMSDSPTIRSAMGFFEELLRGCETPNIAVRFWDGSVWRLREDERIEATLVLRHPDSLSRMLRWPVQLALGEAYIYDDIDVLGSLDALLAPGRPSDEAPLVADGLATMRGGHLAPAETRSPAGRNAKPGPARPAP